MVLLTNLEEALQKNMVTTQLKHLVLHKTGMNVGKEIAAEIVNCS